MEILNMGKRKSLACVLAASVLAVGAVSFDAQLGYAANGGDVTPSITAQVGVVAKVGKANASNESILKNQLVSDLTGVTECWYIAVDGMAVARAENRYDLQNILDGITDRYSEENGYSAFIQNVSVAYGLVSRELESDTDAIAKILDPNSDSKYSLDIRTVTVDYTYSDIAYAEVSVERDDLYPHQGGKVIKKGVNGIMETKTERIYENGELVSESSSNEISEQPVNAQVAVGTKQYSTEYHGCYIWPTFGNMTSGFGPRSGGVGSRNHQGIDICGALGRDIRAAESGTVIYAKWMNGYGNLVQIKHENGDVTYYAHNSELCVCVGDVVYQGQVIAKMGSTGTSSANHCHFEVRVNGGKTPIDPMSVLP